MSKRILPGVLDSISRGYNITNSLANIEYVAGAYDNDPSNSSSFLTYTPKALGNPRVFTFSTWFKKNTIEYDYGGNAQIIFSSRADNSGSPWFIIYLDGNDKLTVLTPSSNLGTDSRIRDTSAWYHLVVSVDTTQATDSNRVKVWLNGIQQTLNGTFPVQNYVTAVSQPYEHTIGTQDQGNNQIFDGLLADTILVDGLNLNADSFGKTNTTTGRWDPIEYVGSVGKTGFYLKYNDTSDIQALGHDFKQTLISGDDRHFGAVTMLLNGNTAGTNTFVDSSSNNFTVTRFGNTCQGTVSPFYTHGSVYNSSIGSGYFDGSGDYLEIPDNEAFNFGSGNWTVEYWGRASGTSANESHPVITQSSSGASSDSAFFIGHGTNVGVYLSSGTGWTYNAVTTIESTAANKWHHIAVVRNGTLVSVYVDGVSSATVTLPAGWTIGNSSRAVQVGFQTGGSNYKGYISNLRVVKGTAVYTSNFTRPTSPLTAISGTSLLLNFANTSFPDSAAINNFENVGSVSINTSTKKFGTGSLYFDGSSYLKTASKPAIDLAWQGSGFFKPFGRDFTIEAWINTTDGVADLVSAFNAASPFKGYLFGIGFSGTAGTLAFYTGDNTATGTNSQTFYSTGTVNNGQWRHVAVTRQGPLLRFYIDGVLDSTHGIYINPLFSDENIHIGADKNSATGRYYIGYLDNLRITKGIARYTGSSFTVPAAEFAEKGTHHWVPNNMFLHNGERINNPTYGAHRYWRYVEGAAIDSHHPRVARIILSTATSDTTIYTNTADNRADSGTIAPGTQSYDFGSPVTIVNARIWSSYGTELPISLRSAYASVQYSDDNTNWKTAFGGMVSNYTNTGIISMIAPARSSSLFDSPTDYSAASVRGTYPVLNHQGKQAATRITGGGLEFDNRIGNYTGFVTATMEIPTSGQWYWEAQKLPNRNFLAGISKEITAATYVGGTSTSWGYWNTNGEIYNNGVVVASGNTINDYDIIGFLMDSTAGTLKFYKNNVLVYTANVGSGPWYPAVGSQYGQVLMNFGQKPFVYSLPSGAKTLNTFNLPSPTITVPNRYFDTKLYTGSGGTQTISGFNFAPNLVWIKDRGLNGNEYWHRIYDTVRGTGQKALYSNTTENQGYWEGIGSAYDSDRLTAFTSTGFTVEDRAGGGGTNDSGTSYVNWSWKEDAISGMDIVTYTGDASASGRTIAHNLGVTPDMIIIKRLDATGHWIIQHRGLNAVQANSSTFTLSSYTNNLLFTDAATINYGYDGQVNTAGGSYVAYLFAGVPGFSKFGTYTSNGLVNGPYVYTGFAPRFVMWKSTATSREWIMKDRSREAFNQSPDNARNLAANRGDQENDSALLAGPSNANNIDWMSNGFKIRYNNANMNSSSATETYIYMAFAETPFKYARGRI